MIVSVAVTGPLGRGAAMVYVWGYRTEAQDWVCVHTCVHTCVYVCGVHP